MNRLALLAVVVSAAVCSAFGGATVSAASTGQTPDAAGKTQSWQGVDDVIEKLAEESGHPAPKPRGDADQGDLLLFAFLLAGAVGGFVAGYTFRGLFPRTRTPRVPEQSS
jgi:hypothetical protein